MTKNLRETLESYAREGNEKELIDAFTAIAASESQLASFHCSLHERQVWPHDLVDKLMGGDDAGIGEGLALLDQYYRYRICGCLRRRYRDLAPHDLVSIWQEVLLSVLRRARQHTLQIETELPAILWGMTKRCAAHVMRRQKRQVSRIENLLRGSELGRMWQMLTDLQQEEVLGLIWAMVTRFTRVQKSVWNAYLRSLLDDSFPATAELTGVVAHQSDEHQTVESVEQALRCGRGDILAFLQSHGYELSDTALHPLGEMAAAQKKQWPEFGLDQLAAEAFRSAQSQDPEPPAGLGDAEKYLSDADRKALDDLGPELSEIIFFEHRTLPTPETGLWSYRCDTALCATTSLEGTGIHSADEIGPAEVELKQTYEEIVRNKRLDWAPDYHWIALLGEGGQGAVYLVRCPGDDGYENLLALKIFDPRHTPGRYEEHAQRMAHAARIVASIHHPNMLDVIDFKQQRGVRMMLMERIDGYDLGRLMVPAMLERIQRRVSHERWKSITNVVVKSGPTQPRLRPGVGMAIMRHCLAALEEMHNRGIVHGDIKPWNIMLTRNGIAKLIDIGSSFPWKESHKPYHCTPLYLAPEVMQGAPYTPQSDLASLGYVLIELLSGRSLFGQLRTEAELLQAKRDLPQRLADPITSFLPTGAGADPTLVSLCQRLIEPDPARRFKRARDAYLDANTFLDNLARSELSVAWEHEIRMWLEDVG